MLNQYLMKLPKTYKTLAIKNILDQWLKSINSVSTSVTINSDDCRINQPDHEDQVLQTINKSLIADRFKNNTSFGIVHKCSLLEEKDHHQHENVSLVYFSTKAETFQFQQMLSRIRYHWFRKLSRSPLNSGFTSAFDEDRNVLNIAYQTKHCDESPLHVEQIAFNSPLIDRIDAQLADHYTATICRSRLDQCFLAFLDDAFVIKNNKFVSKLNPSLSPYKIAIHLEDASCEKAQNQMQQVADYLVEQLQPYPYLTVYSQKTSAQISDFLSIPYLVIVKEDTLRTGFLALRNRDTQLAETVHISNFGKILLFYLHPEGLSHKNAQKDDPSGL